MQCNPRPDLELMIDRIDYSDEEATNAKIGWPNIVQTLDGNLRSAVPGNPSRLSGGFLCFKKVANMAKQKERQNPTNKSTDQTDEKKPNLGDFAAKKLGFQKGKLPKDWSREIFRK